MLEHNFVNSRDYKTEVTKRLFKSVDSISEGIYNKVQV